MTQSIINCSNARGPIKKIHLYFLQRKSMFIPQRKHLKPPFAFLVNQPRHKALVCATSCVTCGVSGESKAEMRPAAKGSHRNTH